MTQGEVVSHEDPNDGVMTLITYDADTNGIVFGNRIIGEYDPESGVMTLDAGWCRLAGIGLKVTGDPAHDRKRVVFERPLTDHTLASGA